MSCQGITGAKPCHVLGESGSHWNTRISPVDALRYLDRKGPIQGFWHWIKGRRDGHASVVNLVRIGQAFQRSAFRLRTQGYPGGHGGYADQVEGRGNQQGKAGRITS